MEYTLKEEIQDKFLQISESISIIEERCKNIQNVDDFLLSPWGMTILDACIMRIQVIGETIKAVDDKTQKNFLKDYRPTGKRYGRVLSARDCRKVRLREAADCIYFETTWHLFFINYTGESFN